LFPILGIKKTANFSPTGTYVALNNLINPEDMKLIVSYKRDDSEGFKKFEEQMLIGNPLYRQVIEVQDHRVYVFDFKIHMNDWFNFLLGKYSQLSNVFKRAIREYYGEESSEYTYIKTFLYPKEYFDQYAKLLDVDVSVLQKIGELCDPCDLEKETLKIPVELLEISEKAL
jgi:hypothetical protein